MACKETKDTGRYLVMMSPISTRNITGTYAYGPGYGLHTISVMQTASRVSDSWPVISNPPTMSRV